MASEKLVQMLSALRLGTIKDQLVWQDLPDEDMFRTPVAGGLIRIGMTQGLSIGQTRQGFTLAIIGPQGTVAADVEFRPGEDGYDVIEDLYTTVRLKVRQGTQIIDNIISQSRAWK
jgi:hypothetical protein